MNLADAQRITDRFQSFEEAILLGFHSSNLLDVRVIVSTTWTESGQLRPDLDKPHLVMLSFRSCQRIEISNNFPPEHLGAEANWGLSEFASLRVKQGNDSQLEFTFKWESDRSVKITCLALEITEEVPQIEEISRAWLNQAVAPLLPIEQ